jgi:hypothetical protein
MVAMHACIVLGLCEYDIPTACDVERCREQEMMMIIDEMLPFVACIWYF